MTTAVAKPEGEDVGRFRAGQAKRRPGGVNRLLKMLGPGVVTDASDDDPSGIGTYSQVGAQLGYGLLWTTLISYPLMAAIQEISARIGRVTGCGIAANLRKSYPKPLLYAVLVAVAMAHIFNLGADLGAMGDALHLLVPGKVSVFVVGFGAASLIAILFVPYSTYVKYLKWLTLSLFAYVGVMFLLGLKGCCERLFLRRPSPLWEVAKRWQQARTAMVVAECGIGVHHQRSPFTALAMVPPHLVEKWAREAFLTLPGIRVFLIDRSFSDMPSG